MAMIRQAEARARAGAAVVLDLGDLARQAQALRAHAQEQADAILADARRQRDQLIAGAAERGHAEGLARGLKEGTEQGRAQGHDAALAESRARLDELAKAWEAALADFDTQRDALLREARADLLRLALQLAERIVKRAIDAKPDAVADQLASALTLVARPTRLTIAVAPDDLEEARRALPSILQKLAPAAHAELTADPDLPLGSCILRTPSGGQIDASVPTMLESIAQTLLPEPPARRAAPAPAARIGKPGAEGRAA